MAEELIVGGVGEIVNRLISLGFEEIGLLLGVKKEVQNLRGVVKDIQAVLQDAEEKQGENETLRVWLKDLKQVAYDAEDVMDEIAYEELRCSIINNKVRTFFSSSNRVAVCFKIAHKIKDINKRLGDIDKRKNRFQLITTVEPNQNDPSNSERNNTATINVRETSSFVEESAVVGRETDKGKIVNMLINHGSSSSDSDQGTSSNTISVVPIVGLGGLGKTMLAQLVYNDVDVKKHFDLRIWICVSHDFDTKILFTQILEQIGTSCESSSKQVLQNNLERQLNGKKVLLVLDDVWNEEQEKWDDLALPLQKFGAVGSKLIVTTRSQKVALIARAQETFPLQILSDDDCWTLFERLAFIQGGAEKTFNLVAIGKEIVKKCKGVPLAAKVLGGLMQSKRSENEWQIVLDNEIWNMSDEQNKIIEVLKLSYNNLSPPLRQCFSYCSIFRQDYEIEKETLIQLWMAQGFLNTFQRNVLMEDVGEEYFNILCLKSFFQDIKKNEFGDAVTCKMHDLVHDLAKFVATSECEFTDVKYRGDVSEFHHLSSSWDEGKLAIPKDLPKANKLRTYSFDIAFFVKDYYCTSLQMTFLYSLFKLRLLRVLQLENIKGMALPSSIGELKHLRYLGLCWASIKVLPASITKLYNLQTLKLKECSILCDLPKDLGNLINLRHLDLKRSDGWEFKSTPKGLGGLRFLQTLTLFKLCPQSAGNHIAELECLNHLRGELNIYGLEEVKDATFAKKANLSGKKNLQKLSLNYLRSSTTENYYDFEDDVLEALQPHSDLKKLSVDGFQGRNLPRWVTDGTALSDLVKLKISNCHTCTHIKSFGGLRSLKELEIEEMTNIKRVGDNVIEAESSRRGGVEEATVQTYPSLKKLTLKSLPNLEEWLDNMSFPNLEELRVRGCGNLRKTPCQFPSLKRLVLDGLGEEGVRSITDSLTSLTSFSIHHCEDLSFLSSSSADLEGLLQKNNLLLERLKISYSACKFIFNAYVSCSLRFLWISHTCAVKSMPDLSGLTLLKELIIVECEQLETIAGLHLLTALERLVIRKCRELKLDGVELKAMRSLVDLEIEDIPNLTQLPVEFLHNNEHLRDVSILGCPRFQDFVSSDDDQQVEVPPPGPRTPSLELLRLVDCPNLLPLDFQSLGLTHLHQLTFKNSGGLVMPCEGFRFLPALEKLSVGPYSEELDYFPFPIEAIAVDMNHLASSLCELRIYGWYNCKSMPHQIRHLHQLKLLGIYTFHGLTSLPEWLGALTSLQEIIIFNCKNLVHLPSQKVMRQLTSLRELHVMCCPLLRKRCTENKRGGGGEWQKISHIPTVWFSPL